MIDNYILYKNIPELDLHGEYKESARVLLKEFINDNLKMNNLLIKVVHGKGSYTIKKEVHKVLKSIIGIFEFTTGLLCRFKYIKGILLWIRKSKRAESSL